MDKEEIFEAVRGSLVEELGIEDDKVSMTASFSSDLGLESLDLLKLFFSLEKKTKIRIKDFTKYLKCKNSGCPGVQ